MNPDYEIGDEPEGKKAKTGASSDEVLDEEAV